jgi:chromosome segregation ATPase
MRKRSRSNTRGRSNSRGRRGTIIGKSGSRPRAGAGAPGKQRMKDVDTVFDKEVKKLERNIKSVKQEIRILNLDIFDVADDMKLSSFARQNKHYRKRINELQDSIKQLQLENGNLQDTNLELKLQVKSYEASTKKD